MSKNKLSALLVVSCLGSGETRKQNAAISLRANLLLLSKVEYLEKLRVCP